MYVYMYVCMCVYIYIYELIEILDAIIVFIFEISESTVVLSM